MGCCDSASGGNANASWGPNRWRELHRSLHDAAWLASWVGSLPCPECRADTEALIAEMPPDFSNADDFFVWTVALHNRVNARLGKPAFPLASALLAREACRMADRHEIARRQSICASCEHHRAPTLTTSHECALSKVPLWQFATKPASECPASKW